MNFDTIHKAQSALCSSGKSLGTLLWWSLNGNRVTHDDLVAHAEHHGLHERYLPKPVRPSSAFKRAWRHASTKMPQGLMLRAITEDADRVTIGLVREQPNEAARDLDYQVLSRIEFDKDNHRISADVENGVADQVRRLYRHHLDHTTQDIRATLSTFLAEAGISLREHGGVYLVAPTHEDTLEAMCKVVEAVGKNTTYRLPIVDTAEGKKTLRAVAKRSLEDELAQLTRELGKFDPDKVRASTLERKLAGFDELRARATLFARVLSFRADKLNQRIAAVQSAIKMQLTAESPQHTDGPEDFREEAPPPQSVGVTYEPFSPEAGF